MKWNVVKKGLRRVVRRFAWLPTKLDTDTMIWLKPYFACQEYHYIAWSLVKWHTVYITQRIERADAWKAGLY